MQREYQRSLRCAARLLGALLSLGSFSFAQVARSGLSGTVTDSSGRLLPQARVTAVQGATGLRRETASNSSGNYSIPQLPVGVYTVTFD
ncbi:MAG: carboxypeptidase-like regulatory domain-containing protein, partial [Acidobacteriaceae bacterium]